jgi:hypothetical protein
MSTNINITVGDSGLLDRARQQQGASRHAQLIREASTQLKTQAIAARTTAFAALGFDINGNLITGAHFSQPQIVRIPTGTRRSANTYVSEARVDLDAITSDQFVFHLSVRYGFGRNANKITKWTELSTTITVDGVAEAFREPDMPMEVGRLFGGHTSIETLLLFGIESNNVPFMSLRPSAVFLVKGFSLWNEWVPNPGFDIPFTNEVYTIPVQAQGEIGAVNPLFDDQITDFFGTPQETLQYTTLFDFDAVLAELRPYAIERNSYVRLT